MTTILKQLAENKISRTIFVLKFTDFTDAKLLGLSRWPSEPFDPAGPKAKLYRFLGTDRRHLNCQSSIIIYAILDTIKSGEKCNNEDVLAANVPIAADIPYVELTWELSLFGTACHTSVSAEESGYYIYVRTTEGYEYQCGPYSTYAIGREAQLAFLRSSSISAAGNPYYYSERPTDYGFCRPAIATIPSSGASPYSCATVNRSCSVICHGTCQDDYSASAPGYGSTPAEALSNGNGKLLVICASHNGIKSYDGVTSVDCD